MLIAFLILIYVAEAARVWYRLRHIPGPRLVGWTKWWLIRAHTSGRKHLDLAEVCEKYEIRQTLMTEGKLARIGPNDLVTSDPRLLRRILSVRSSYSRAPYYQGFRLDPSRDNILSQIDDAKHGILRSKMVAGYAGKDNERMEQTMNESIVALMKLIDTKYVSTNLVYRPMDFSRKAQYLALDVISSLAYGKAFGDLEKDEDVHNYIEMIEEAGPNIVLLTVLPVMRKMLRMPLIKNLVPNAKDQFGFGKVMGIAKELASERFGPYKKIQADMLGSFVAHGLTQDEAESEILFQILAGSDTTATAIRVIMLYISTSPRILSNLLSEINTFAPSSPISDAEARKMPYLQAIIKEGLRIWPPVQGLSSKEVPQGGDTINGVFVPGGTAIGYAATAIFRDEEIWGPDAKLFHPERWLIHDERRLKEMNAVWELVFSYGKWQCLGKNVAMMELNKVIVEDGVREQY
ncbi:Cytochrome P450 monooxygenase lolP1 [Hyphodiscus hymeniophilus]|uniref:Cytochrome P450 monooxygenase lolP1 n=1 Tax=Hyphodiscus hymeniophilus TaxID=353542 RepID=A0A9P6SN96_9HELO|nr:Cytochrome P450 monooxygenase lolP1 [Hyphodiscus hymeniophilus]